jgi:hypothetical protein
MRLLSTAILAGLLLSGAAYAAEPTDDEILSDLFVVSAAPRPADVKMVVQTAKPADKQAKTETPAQDAPASQPIKTASR